MMKNLLKTFKKNTAGRDFVIGDLHGCFSLFSSLCENLNFDPLKDRMFSVGDLVDRGPESQRCLALTLEPWFHTVLGNHEQLMIEAFIGHSGGYWWKPNGGEWGQKSLNAKNYSEAIKATEEDLELFDLVEHAKTFPLVITVEGKSGEKFHIVHSEFPPNFLSELSDEVLSSEENIRRYAGVMGQDGNWMLWGRFLFVRFAYQQMSDVRAAAVGDHIRTGWKINQPKDKLGKIITGHTILTKPITLCGHTNIDTGAYYNFDTSDKTPIPDPGLTCIELDTWKFYHSSAAGVKEIYPLSI